MVNKLSIEVSRHGGLFEALVTDIKNEDDSYIKVAYKENCFPEEFVSITDVIMPSNINLTSFKEGQVVEVYFNRKSGLAWWRAYICSVNCDDKTNLVQFINPSEIKKVPWNKIRLVNKNTPIRGLCKDMIQIPFEFDKEEHIEFVLQKFQTTFFFPFCEYIPKLNAVKIIYFQRKIPFKSGELVDYLWSIYFDIFGEDFAKCSNLDDDQSSTEENNVSADHGQLVQNHRETFTIPKFLIGLALGPQGENLKLVKTLDGLTKVNFDRYTNKFFINGKSKEIVKIARNLLEYTKQEVKISEYVANMLLKNNGEFLQAVVDECGLVRIEVEPESDPSFALIGTKGSVTEAQNRLINYPVYSQETRMFSRNNFKTSAPKASMSNPFKKCVEISKELVKLLYNRNAGLADLVLLAKNIHGVQRIEEEENSTHSKFTVYGTTREAVTKAVDVLEIVEDSSCHIEPYNIGQLIGINGCNIKKIISESGLLRLNVGHKQD